MSDKKQHPNFSEQEWLKLLFLLSDTQEWLNDLNKALLNQLPISKKRFISKNYYLTVPVATHILERHYVKINRYPHAGKFNIPVIDILTYIRDAHDVTPVPIGGSNLQRIVEAPDPVGHDKNGRETNIITIVTDAGGKIITAFPGNDSLKVTLQHPVLKSASASKRRTPVTRRRSLYYE